MVIVLSIGPKLEQYFILFFSLEPSELKISIAAGKGGKEQEKKEKTKIISCYHVQILARKTVTF